MSSVSANPPIEQQIRWQGLLLDVAAETFGAQRPVTDEQWVARLLLHVENAIEAIKTCDDGPERAWHLREVALNASADLRRWLEALDVIAGPLCPDDEEEAPAASDRPGA